MWNVWWVWIVAGFSLGVIEVLVPGFVFLGFAIGAVITGLAMWLGIIGGSLPVTLAIFAVLSLISWIVLRRIVGVSENQTKLWQKDIND